MGQNYSPAQIEAVAVHLLGEPTSRRRTELRWRSKGSLRVTISCDGAGLYHDKESGEGGDLIGLAVARRVSDSYRRRNWWDPLPVRRGSPRIHRSPGCPLRWEERAEQIWYSTDPLPGTLGETYLRSRCCYVETAWDIRFLKPSINYRPAVVGRITDFESGDPMSLVFIDLDLTGQKIRKRNLPGYPVAKGVVRLSANEPVDGTLGVAEGIETALSVIAAEKGPCWATLGTANMRKLPVLNRYGNLTLNIWGDNGEPGKEAAEELAERWMLRAT